ncbi:hypothetical protein AB0L06_20045 [Spirillospora sp. NPDC052269]
MSRTKLVRSSASTSRPWRNRAVLMAVPVAALAVAATGCGSSSNSSNSGGETTRHSPVMNATSHMATSPMSPMATGTPGAGGKIATASVGSLGKILVDGKGRTVYLFEKDQGGKSSCTGACAAVWPPVPAKGKPQAGSGANASMLGTTSRGHGIMQVTYNKHPLYYYTPDTGTKGSAKGEGLNQFGGAWYVVSPAGKKVEQGNTGGGGGY